MQKKSLPRHSGAVRLLTLSQNHGDILAWPSCERCVHGRVTVRPRSNVCVWRIFCASQCSGFCLERGGGDFHCSRLSVHWTAEPKTRNTNHKKACAECFFRMRFRPLNTTSTGTVRELAFRPACCSAFTFIVCAGQGHPLLVPSECGVGVFWRFLCL